MPRVFPSLVIKVIDRLFPWAETQQEGKPYPLYFGNHVQLMGIMRMVEEIPEELITLTPEDYAVLVVCVEGIRTQVETWYAQGARDTLNFLGGLPQLSPIALIRRCLAKCPDEAPSPGTVGLQFIPDIALRDSIRLDISAAYRDEANGQWKGATVLAGSAAEALLLWAIQEHEKKSPGDLATALSRLVANKTFPKPPDPNPEKWDLYEYIPVASDLKIIKPETATQVELARPFRNLIHPGRAKRLGQTCDRATALAALSAVEFLVRDLTP